LDESNFISQFKPIGCGDSTFFLLDC